MATDDPRAPQGFGADATSPLRRCPHGVTVGPLDDYGVPDDVAESPYSVYCWICNKQAGPTPQFPDPQAACGSCDAGVRLVNVAADRPDLPPLWAHQYGDDPGTLAQCIGPAREIERLRRFLNRIADPTEITGDGQAWLDEVLAEPVGVAARELRARVGMAARALEGDENP